MHTQQTLLKEGEAPLVTFIITYYNLPADMLCECVDSILKLSLGKDEREIIIIDDGSAENPVSALHERLDNVIYVRQPNTGLSVARNRGLQMASGQYVQFVDADDYLIQTPYEHCLDLVRRQLPDVVMFDFTDGNDTAQSSHDFSVGDLKSGSEYLSQHNLQATACCYLFRRHILGSLCFTPGIYHEDEEFTPQLLLRAETICSTDAQAYNYRHRPQSITTATDRQTVVKRLNDIHTVIVKLNRLADTLPTSDRIALQRRVAQLTMDYIYNIITLTRDAQFLDSKLDELRNEGLFPLPDKDYTLKYKWFRRLTNSRMGLKLLMGVLPRMNKER